MRFEGFISKAFWLFFSVILFLHHVSFAQTPQKAFETPALAKNKPETFKEGETVVAEIEFAGFDTYNADYASVVERPIYEYKFLMRLRDEKAIIRPGEKFSARKIGEILVLLKEWLADEGYFKAEVVALGEKLPEKAMKLVFLIRKNEMSSVSELLFSGNKNVASEELIADFKQCAGDSWKTFRADVFRFYATRCSYELLLSKGYVSARIPRVSRRWVSGQYVVTIEVDEGIRYRLGEITIAGGKLYNQKQLLELLDLKTGDIADGKMIRSFFKEKLKQVYFEKGYLLYDYEFDFEFVKPLVEGLDGTLNVAAAIDEGRPLGVAKIDFVGIEKQDAEKLKEDFPLKEGDIFSESKFKEGVEKINQTKKFFPIDYDGHVDLRTNAEKLTVDVIVRTAKIE